MVTSGALPYPRHTNHELGMMLRGEKPLAVFNDGYGSFPIVVQRYLRLFELHVRAGRFVKREYVVPERTHPRVRGWHTILFALSGEQWRIDAMIELRLSDGWSLEHEREEGRLLGYEDWQNDLWLSRWTKFQSQGGFAITPADRPSVPAAAGPRPQN